MGDYVIQNIGIFKREKILSDNLYSILKNDKQVSQNNNEKGTFVGVINNTKSANILLTGLDERGIYLAKKIVNKLDLSKNKKLIDIGSGSGIYSCILATYNPKLKIDILEIPTVVPNTNRFLKQRGFSNRISVISGDMFKYNYNKEYDVHFYSNVLHDWDVKDVTKILKTSYKGLPIGGKIIIHDGHKELKNNPWSLLENEISLLVKTKGRYYYTFEIKEMLRKVGFKKIEKMDLVSGRSLIIAYK
jgi:3-hydroxy-5-methyl-1-naphthoate 3-O-methyltransferase